MSTASPTPVFGLLQSLTPLERSELLRLLIEAAEPTILETLGERLDHVSTAQTDAWMTSEEAAAYLALTKTALHKLTAARRIPFHQDGPGCKLWFKRSELDEWRRSGGGRRGK